MLRVIGEVWEEKTFIEGAEGGGEVAEIVRRADDQPISAPDGLKHWGKAILLDARPFEFLFLAAKARDAAGKRL